MNGRSIVVDETIGAYSFFHVELETHGILLAEGLAAESYLDTGNRAQFAAGYILAPAARDWDVDSCAPLAVDQATVQPIWDRLERRAMAFGIGTQPMSVG